MTAPHDRLARQGGEPRAVDGGDALGKIFKGLVERTRGHVAHPLLFDLREDLADRHGRRHPSGGHRALHERDHLVDLRGNTPQAGEEVVVILRVAQGHEARQRGDIEVHAAHLRQRHPLIVSQPFAPRAESCPPENAASPRLAERQPGTGRTKRRPGP